MNRLLIRQIKKHLGELFDTEASYKSESFQELLKSIDQAYEFRDKELRLLERTIDLNSKELNDANKLLKQQNEEISKMAKTDALTGLPNRYIFNNQINKTLEMAKRHNTEFAVLFIDLDRFKIINDSLGHHVGDLLLKHVAMRLISSVREVDTIARLGGDEFTILLDDVKNDNDTSKVAKKVLDKLSQPYYLERYELFITASIGISKYPYDGGNLVELFKNADAAMYQAKELGRNNFKFYHSDMGEKLVENMALESKLRRALDREELILYYQPQIDLTTGKICGLEALIRWNSPESGIMAPDKFIPVAEETGLILPIGEWVLQTACYQNKQWQRAGLPKMRVAINVSFRQLHSQNFLSSIDAVLEMTNIEPQFLEIELTESSVMKETKFSMKILQEIKQRGIIMTIDDFGTGYSSLSYLKQFTINKLKIDQSFVRDIEDNSDAIAIVEAIIAMSHSLKLIVIAEGVETQSQLNYLKEKGCDQIQGFWFSKPIPADEIALMLKNNPNFLNSAS